MCRQEGGGHGAFLLTEGMDARSSSGLAHPLRPGPQKARVSAMPVTRCPPGGGVTTICTADNRGTNSTAPEYSAPAAHPPQRLLPGGVVAGRGLRKIRHHGPGAENHGQQMTNT